MVFREAGPQDVRGIFELSNHPSVRQASFNRSPITWSEHCEWFDRTRREPLCGFYVMEIGGALAGQIRFRSEGTLATVSISIDPRHRGKGVGASLYHQALAAFRARHPVSEVVAKIRKENTGSAAFFSGLGFAVHSIEWINGQEAIVMRGKPENPEVSL